MTTRDVDGPAPVQPVLPVVPARLTELAMFLDVDGTPCNASLSAATPATVTDGRGPTLPATPAAAMGVFILNHPPEWSPEQKARVARDLATALHAAADDIGSQWGTATAWGG